mgnify:CR=1 FL=1
MKNTPGFHDSEFENISGESTGGAALIRGRRLLTFLSQLWHFFEGGAYLRAALIRVNTVWFEGDSECQSRYYFRLIK